MLKDEAYQLAKAEYSTLYAWIGATPAAQQRYRPREIENLVEYYFWPRKSKKQPTLNEWFKKGSELLDENCLDDADHCPPENPPLEKSPKNRAF